jgi:predicted secreted Zn-dependent protease
MVNYLKSNHLIVSKLKDMTHITMSIIMVIILLIASPTNAKLYKANNNTTQNKLKNSPTLPTVNIETTYYSVEGITEVVLRKDMSSKTPIRQEGKAYDASTLWKVKWKFDYKTTKNTDCKITAINTIVSIVYTYPKWIDYNTGNIELKKKWNKYYKALIKHEEAHKDNAIKAAKEIQMAILQMGNRENCDIIKRHAHKLAHKIVAEYSELDKQYDIKTKHGIKNGAIFP